MEERQKIVLMRVDPKLAVYIQNLLKNGPLLSWRDFKQHLSKELTDQSQNKLFDAINDLRYSYDEDPVEFMNKLKCKFALLEVRSQAEVPKREKLIKTKLNGGMPKDCRARLELSMDDNISIEKFLDKLEVERARII